MDYVKNTEYYHVHRVGSHDDLWQANKTIFFGQKERNLFNSYYDNNAPGMFIAGDQTRYAVKTALTKILSQPENYKLDDYIKMLKFLVGVIDDQCMFIRETIFEEVRKNYFPQLPSRQTCIWVEEKGAVPYWWNTLAKEGIKFKIFKLSLTGVIHRTDQRYLIADTLIHSDLRANAFKYWTGADGSNPTEEELLFEGIIQIIEGYTNLDEFTKVSSRS